MATVTNIYGETIEGLKVSTDSLYRCCDIYEDAWGERHAFENGTSAIRLQFDEEECKKRGVPQYVLNHRGAHRS